MKRSWAVCGLLFLATTLNYLDRQTMSVLAPQIRDELGLDNQDIGNLFSVFYYAYTAAQFAVGALVDRVHLRWLYGLAVVAWSLVAALTGLASGFLHLLLFRLLLGVTESANWPAALRIVARLLPPEKRTIGNGIFTSGTSVGALIAPFLILSIAESAGWRVAFVAVGSLGFVWFLLWVAATGHRSLAEVWRGEKMVSHGYGPVMRLPQFWIVFCITILVNPCLYFLLNWLPLFLDQQHGIRDKAELARLLTTLYLGLDAGYLACGGLLLLLVRRGVSLPSARRMVMALATLMLGAAGGVAVVPSRDLLVPLLVFANFGAGLWISMYLTLAQEVHPRHAGTAAGLLGGSGSLAGAVAMNSVGWVTQSTGSYALPLFGVSIAGLLALGAGWRATRAPIT